METKQDSADAKKTETGHEGHKWQFFRASGFNMVRLDTGADIAALPELDQKLWCALACPASGLEFDTRTLQIMDADKDGRIRPPELLEAIKWTCRRLKNPDTLLAGSNSLRLEDVADANPEGKLVRSTIVKVLESLKKSGATEITIEDTTKMVEAFNSRKFNGDGVIVPSMADDDADLKTAIEEIMLCVGSIADSGGGKGINKELAEKFFKDAGKFRTWWRAGLKDPAIDPLGEKTGDAFDSMKAVRPKVNDYFARCRLAAFDIRAIQALNTEVKQYLSMAAKDLTITSAEIAALPLSRIEAGRPLPLKGNDLNPAFAEVMELFAKLVVEPVLGSADTLTEEGWNKILAFFAAHEAWVKNEEPLCTDKLPPARVIHMLEAGVMEKLQALIAQDEAVKPEAQTLSDVEKLVLYNHGIFKLLKNFVTFEDFYDGGDLSIFQAGTLYMDSRGCELCLRTSDIANHIKMASLGHTFLAYCECVRRGTGEKMNIAAAFTNGDSDNLIVGRNGVFYDQKGNDWDATIVQVLDNPISIKQAFWSPYKKVLRLIEERIGKRASESVESGVERLSSAAETRFSGALTAGTKVVEEGQQPVESIAAQAKPKIDIGTVAALGVAVGGITAALGYLLQSFFGLGIMMPIGLAAIIGLISGCSMLIAWMKLRQRNLGPLLDANGWAVNSQAKMNIAFGTTLTHIAALPPGSTCDHTDRYADKKHRWRGWGALAIVVFLALSWWLGKLDGCMPGVAKSTSVLGEIAPSFKHQKEPAGEAEKSAAPQPAVTGAPAVK